jgi:predicted MFS family arabinose efflux permease
MCTYLGLTVLGFHGVAALLPGFMDLWQLSETQAGWLLGVMSLCSLLASPAIALTDRVDTRWVLLAGTVCNIVGYAGFGLFADGLVSGMFFRGLAGVGYVLSYMPGIKAMADRLAPADQARATATYVSSFSICSSLSVALAGLVAGWAGWRWAFAVPVLSNLVAAALVLFVLKPAKPSGAGAPAAPHAESSTPQFAHVNSGSWENLTIMPPMAGANGGHAASSLAASLTSAQGPASPPAQGGCELRSPMPSVKRHVRAMEYVTFHPSGTRS